MITHLFNLCRGFPPCISCSWITLLAALENGESDLPSTSCNLRVANSLHAHAHARDKWSESISWMLTFLKKKKSKSEVDEISDAYLTLSLVFSLAHVRELSLSFYSDRLKYFTFSTILCPAWCYMFHAMRFMSTQFITLLWEVDEITDKYQIFYPLHRRLCGSFHFWLLDRDL